MAVTVSKYPSLITGVDNPVVFELSVAHTIAGTKALLNILYTIDETEGAEYIIAWDDGGKTVTLECVVTPDSSGNQFPTRQGENWEEWISIVADYISDNALLAADFNILPFGQDMILALEAKETGAYYTMDVLLTNSEATISKNTAGVDDVDKVNHMIGLQVWRRIDSVDTMISEDLSTGMIKGGNLVVMFDVAEVLAADCLSEVTCDVPSSLSYIARNDVAPAYFVKYYEQYTGFTPSVLISRWFFSLNGGIPEWKQLAFFATYANLQAYLTGTHNYFLTWCDFAKPTDQLAPEKLYLIFPTKPTATNFYLILTKNYYDDGSEVQNIAVHKTFYAGKVFELDVSPETLIGTVPDNMLGYDIQFKATDDSYYSSVFSFLIDRETRVSTRYFVFKNSLGGFECARFFGAMDMELAIKRETFSQSALSEYTEGYLPAGQQKPEVTRSLKLNSGMQCQAYFDWLQDFLQSDTVYEVDGENWIPVLVLEDKVVISDDLTRRKQISITVQYPDHNTIFQRELSAAWSTVSSVSNPYS